MAASKAGLLGGLLVIFTLSKISIRVRNKDRKPWQCFFEQAFTAHSIAVLTPARSSE